jgi:crotonobetaine/carnitine-CoA ligase
MRTEGDGDELTYEALHREVDRTARGLQAVGVEAADRVAVMMTNRIEYPVLWLACARLGATMVPVNRRSGLLDARYVLEHSGASVLVADGECATTARSAALSASRAPTVIEVAVLPANGSPRSGPPS